jgi:hypothetical protein
VTVPDVETFLRGLVEREPRNWGRGGREGPPFPPQYRLGLAIATLTQAQVIDEHSAFPLPWELNVALAVRSGVQADRTGTVIRRAGRYHVGSGSGPHHLPFGELVLTRRATGMSPSPANPTSSPRTTRRSR